MHRTTSASLHLVRVGVFGLFTLTAAAVFTTDSAEARHAHRHVAHHSHHDDDDSYSPQFSSIIVDANSGATLESNSPDGLRHPASLTKVMTLYLLFERLESGKMRLDTEMPVSEHASEQAPTKLGLRPGQTIAVEDAIKGIVTRSANDAAVVIAEAIGGDEDDFAKMMTHKAHALGMSRTSYHNASGLPDDEQLTTARDQATLGRAIQERFPRYYRYFSTLSFNYHGQSISNHNHLLGAVEGVDGIKTGYTRASGFNLLTSMRRGNRHLIGVVMGGRSGGSRDAIMRNLLAENLDKASTNHTVAAVTERNASDTSADVADAAPSGPAQNVQVASAADVSALPARAPTPVSKVAAAFAQAAAALPPARTKAEPAPLTSGVIQTTPIAIMPGSSEPMKPVRVKTVQIKAAPMKLASAGPYQTVPPVTNALPAARPDTAETSSTLAARAGAARLGANQPTAKPEMERPDLPPQPPGHGTGNGLLGVLPASSLPAASASQAMAYAAPPPAAIQPQPVQQDSNKPVAVHTGWIVQVGALESEDEAQQRIEAARSGAHGLLSKADPFTEPVMAKGDRKLFRARFAGLDRDQAEAVCKALKRSEISCMTVHN
ncbi:serine hydrolase [Bradyrhizobium sp.]|uniref:D-alanyl-D-alanine carboxypeptidase n=1 Tax=Bradyrhizobium sp. TaxID=376 RepID=UPI003C3169D2